MFRSTGHRSLTWLEKLFLSVSKRVRAALLPIVRLDDNGFESAYLCETKWDARRPIELWRKEEGTMRWIDREVEPGSVFMDVGANIGVYTIAAAHRAGPNGRVYAFEPHKVNAITLMRNLALSRLAARVDVFTCPLSDRPAVIRFNYASLSSASSGSQAGHRRAPGEPREFVPIATEVTAAWTVDALIADGAIASPTLVKIDVDGNEHAILRGMQALLTGANRPKAVLVEINRGQDAQIGAFMTECGYRLDQRHFTEPGEARRRRGIPLDEIEHNAIFRPAGP